MEVEGSYSGSRDMPNIEAEHSTDGKITLATIDTSYLKGPITVTSISQQGMVNQEGDLIIESVPENEDAGGATTKDSPFTPDTDHEEQEKEDDDEDYKNVKTSVKNKKGRYYQKFRSTWLKHPDFKDWLARCKDTDDRAYCTVCSRELCAGKSELQRHMKGKKHQKSMEKSGLGTGTVFRSRCDINIKSSDNSDLSTVLDEHGVSHVLHIVDLRSDTVTQPCREMKSAMVSAALGDDAFTEDPTVKTLEVKVATLLEKEAALFVPSGTMANLVCVMAHCWQRGSEVIVGDKSHINISAKGGMAQIGGIHHHTIQNKPDGTFSLDEVQSIVRNNNDNWSSQFLVCVENTHNLVGGKALPIHWMDEVGSVCSQLDVLVHCDGARLMNAAVALGTNPARLVQSCDSVSLCLNKGLGTPMGSVIAGGKDFISRATKIRKILGGGLHQAGFVAAAGMWALDHQVPKLSADHAHARAIAQCVHEEHSSAITVDLKSVQTNIALLHCDNIRVDAKKLCQRLASVTEPESDELEEQVVVMMMPVTDTSVRFMTHCDVRKDDVKSVVKKLRYVIQEYDNMMYLEYKVAT